MPDADPTPEPGAGPPARRESSEPDDPEPPPLRPDVLPPDAPSKSGEFVEVTASFYEGPIPHPDILRQLEAIAPGSAKKIIDNSLVESKDRRESDRLTQQADIRARTLGMKLGAALAFTCLVVGGLVAIYGNPWAGAGIITGTVGVLATSYLIALNKHQKELARKFDVMREVIDEAPAERPDERPDERPTG